MIYHTINLNNIKWHTQFTILTRKIRYPEPDHIIFTILFIYLLEATHLYHDHQITKLKFYNILTK